LKEARAMNTMDPHIILEDYGDSITDLASVSSGCYSAISELADIDELMKLMERPASHADAAVVSSALVLLKPEQVVPALANIAQHISSDVANLVIDSIDVPAATAEVLRAPRQHPVSPDSPPVNLITTVASALVEVVDDPTELAAIATKSNRFQQALIDLAPSIAALISQDSSA